MIIRSVRERLDVKKRARRNRLGRALRGSQHAAEEQSQLRISDRNIYWSAY